MNRSLTIVFSVLESLLVVGIGIGVTLVPLSLMWGFQYGLQVDWSIFWKASVDAWALGHGAAMTVTLDPVTAATVGFADAVQPFILSLSPLGFAVLTLLLGQRAGRRIAETPHSLLGFAAAAVSFGLVALGLVASALDPMARPSIVQGTLITTLVFVVGLTIGAAIARHRLAGTRQEDALDALWERVSDWPSRVRRVVGSALIGGAASVAGIMIVASLLVAGLIAVNYGQIIALYEGAHSGVLGGFALTIGQLAFVPNLVVWAASWLVGPGFAIGAGSAVSPLGTSLGPIPAIPVLGALPSGQLAWGFLGLLVPVLVAFLIGVVLRRRLVASGSADLGTLIVTGLASGAAAGILLGFLAWWSGGSAGPGRLAEVGPSPLLVALWVFVEVGVACTAGLLAGRARADAGEQPA